MNGLKKELSGAPFLILLTFLTAKALAVAWIILNAGIGLGPDEAQYWTWSRRLAAGYYSKPPGIAWQIWLGTLLFGSTELGVRFASIVLGSAIPVATYWLSRECRLAPRTSAWAAFVFAVSPLGVMSTFLAITDVGMVLFWTLALAAVARALSSEKPLPFYLTGLFVCGGALFKWPMYYFWIAIAGLLIVQKGLYRRALWGGVLISFLGLLPSLVWNFGHDFATFRHVMATVEGNPNAVRQASLAVQGNVGEFLGAQALLFSPLFFFLLLPAFWALAARCSIKALAFTGWTVLIPLSVFTLTACFKKIQGNWCDFVYPGAAVLLSWYACEKKRRGEYALALGSILSIAMTAVSLAIPQIESHSFLAEYPLPYKTNPFKHNLGWDHLAETLEKAGYDPEKDFLFADRYQTASILSFYGPDQKLAYFLNLQGIRKNQFSYWPGMAEERIGAAGFFVAVENSPRLQDNRESLPREYQDVLSPYFKKVVFLGVYPIFYSYGKEVKGVFIFKCTGYNGHLPSESALY